jgi:hypothetical protein
MNHMKTTSLLQEQLEPGRVYRRQELGAYSPSVDRQLQRLVRSGQLKKASYGIYYCPQHSRFGEILPEDKDIIRAFLKTDRFLAFSPNQINGLQLGSTQLWNTIRVYNHKRHGIFTIAGKTFDFRHRPEFPHALSAEFLFVEFLNERPHLPEEVPLRPERLKSKLQELDQELVTEIAQRFGKSYTKKIVAELMLVEHST